MINKPKMGNRKLAFGVGTNDVPYNTRDIDGSGTRCPYWIKWYSMLRRVYSSGYHKKFPSYIGTTVSTEWRTFSTFRKWMAKQEWEGNELDKDIMFPGNTEYSEDACRFIPRGLNKLLTDHASRRGPWPQGVTETTTRKGTKRYRARVNSMGKETALGTFGTPEEAYKAYTLGKIQEIKRWQNQLTDKQLIKGLDAHIEVLNDI